jgi:hypothetical protein
MIRNPGKKLNATFHLIILLAIALMPFGGIAGQSVEAAEPLNPEVAPVRGPGSGTGTAPDSAFSENNAEEYNTSSATNNPPQLSSPSVQPPSGTTATSFCYYVNYYDADGDSPSVSQAYIDEIAYTMLLYSGSASNGVYRCVPENLSVDSHEYYFYFEDGKDGGTARLPASGSYSGPVVNQENSPPNIPSSPSPANQAIGVSLDAELSWTGGDPDAGDTVTYDVYFGTGSAPPLVSDDQPGTTYDPVILAYNTKHYWKIVATDSHAAPTVGPVWEFTTGLPEQADIDVSPASFELTLSPDTTQDYTLDIANTGNATLTYNISDRETMGPASAAGIDKPVLRPAIELLKVPAQAKEIESENTGEVQSGWQNILTDGFEGAFPNTDWQLSGNPQWGKESYTRHTGTYSVWCAGSSYDPPVNYPNNMDTRMVYGPFALCDAGAAELNFEYWLDTQSQHDYLRVETSINGTQFFGSSGWSGNSGGWVSQSLDLSHAYVLGNLCGKCQVWIAFRFISDGDVTGEGAFIDDVVLRKYVPPPNNPPDAPSDPSPANHATGVSLDAKLSWTGSDPDPGDTLAYDVLFGTYGNINVVSRQQPASTYDPGTLNGNTTYYWRIIARDGKGAYAISPLWDFATAVVPGSNPPNSPADPLPADHAAGVSIDADLSWTGGDPDPGDTVTYDVYFGSSSPPPLVSERQPGTSYGPGTLDYDTAYYWQIVATDSHDASTTGPLWDFTTTSEDCPWLDETPKSGSLAPGNSDSITVTIDATGLADGDYSAEIVILSNDPDESPTVVPVILHVAPPGANNPPDVPGSPSPADQATGVPIDADLSWTAGDPDAGDTVTYDIHFGTSPSFPLPAASQSATSYDPGLLSYNTTYYWKITAVDNHGAETTGPLWEFTTEPEPGPGIAWNFPSTSNIFLGPTPANGRPYLAAAVPLPTGTEPEELSGVYWLDETTGGWQYFIPALGTGTLTSLEPGQAYMVAVSGPCSWDLPCGEGTPWPNGNIWDFPSAYSVCLAPSPDNARPYLEGAVPLPTGTEPPELSAVYWLDEATGEWHYFIPALGGSTLTSLEPGQAYMVAVSGACGWPIS